GLAGGASHYRRETFCFIKAPEQVSDGLWREICKDHIRDIVVEQSSGSVYARCSSYVKPPRLQITGKMGAGLFIGVNYQNALGARGHVGCPKLPAVKKKGFIWPILACPCDITRPQSSFWENCNHETCR